MNSPGDTAVVYYRTVIGVLFDDSTSGVTVRRVLQKYRATIIGGLRNPPAYIVRVPDPGPTYEAVIYSSRGSRAKVASGTHSGQRFATVCGGWSAWTPTGPNRPRRAMARVDRVPVSRRDAPRPPRRRYDADLLPNGHSACFQGSGFRLGEAGVLREEFNDCPWST